MFFLMKKQQGSVVKIFNNTISTCATAVGCPDYVISFRDGDDGGDEYIVCNLSQLWANG